MNPVFSLYSARTRPNKEHSKRLFAAAAPSPLGVEAAVKRRLRAQYTFVVSSAGVYKDL